MAYPHQQKLEEIEECNKNIVADLYKALAVRDATTVHRLLSPTIEWWFHGPATCNHLMCLLTGQITSSGNGFFDFKPLSIVSISSTTVVAEGCDVRESQRVSWVHAWTVTDGIITQVREYFNTNVTVTRFAKSGNVQMASSRSDTCQSVWQSKLTDNASMPGLLIAL